MKRFHNATEQQVKTALQALRGLSYRATVASVYEQDSIAQAFCDLPGFEYPDWDYVTIGEMREILDASFPKAI